MAKKHDFLKRKGFVDIIILLTNMTLLDFLNHRKKKKLFLLLDLRDT